MTMQEERRAYSVSLGGDSNERRRLPRLLELLHRLACPLRASSDQMGGRALDHIVSVTDEKGRLYVEVESLECVGPWVEDIINEWAALGEPHVIICSDGEEIETSNEWCRE